MHKAGLYSHSCNDHCVRMFSPSYVLRLYVRPRPFPLFKINRYKAKLHILPTGLWIWPSGSLNVLSIFSYVIEKLFLFHVGLPKL